jgi:hypothetical protein
MICYIKSRSASSIHSTVLCFDKMVMCTMSVTLLKILSLMNVTKYSRTPIFRINWDGETSAHVENWEDWTLLSKKAALRV